MRKPNTHYDILVIGAGLVGSSLVLSLQNQGFRIAVLDHDWSKSKLGGRPISLAHASVTIFKQLGLWASLSDFAVPIRAVEVSQSRHLGVLHLCAQDLGVDALGQVIPFNVLSAALLQAVCQQDNVDCYEIARLHALTVHHSGSECQFFDNDNQLQALTADLVIGADGSASRVRDLLNLGVKSRGDAKIALAASATITKALAGIAHQRFTKHEVIALLPQPELDQVALILTLSKETWQQRADWTAQDWQAYLNPLCRRQWGEALDLKLLGQYALQSQSALRTYVPGAVLIGNAAQTLYPLAAQGFNLGLRDAVALAKTLVTARQQTEAIGAEAVLARYQRSRESDHKRIACLTNTLSRVFSSPLPAAGPFRGLGLLALDMTRSAKQAIAQLAMGFDA